MSDFDIKFGPWLNYGKTTIGDKMDDLLTQSWSPFNGCDTAQVFIYCMAYAFAKGMSPTDGPPKSGGGSMPASAFKRDMRDFMKSLAIEDKKSLDVMADPKLVVEIGEKYAYAGFNEVYDRIKNRSSDIAPEKILEIIVREIDSDHNTSTNSSD